MARKIKALSQQDKKQQGRNPLAGAFSVFSEGREQEQEAARRENSDSAFPLPPPPLGGRTPFGIATPPPLVQPTAPHGDTEEINEETAPTAWCRYGEV